MKIGSVKVNLSPVTKLPWPIYLCIPLLAILACNAPIEQLQPAVETIERPTIGPPPTLTPISLQESEFVIVTAIILPTDTPTPVESYTPTAEPTPIPDTPTSQPVLPTVTLDPELEEEGRSTPRATLDSYPPIGLFTYYEWGDFNKDDDDDGAQVTREGTREEDEEGVDETPTPKSLTYQESYEGRLILVGRGGAGVFAYYVNEERISGAIIPLNVENCAEQTFFVTVQSLNSDPLNQEVTVKAPCFPEP